MTRRTAYVLTAVAVALYLALNIVFSEGQFTGAVWDGDAIADSTV